VADVSTESAPEGPSKEPAEATGPAAADAQAAGGATDATGGEAVPLGALATDDLLVWFLGLFAAKAWEGMGLVPNPGSGKIQKDLAGAQLAIDAYGAAFDVLRPRLAEGPRREMETLLTNLRVNFVEKRGE